jgi:hypothetical protein
MEDLDNSLPEHTNGRVTEDFLLSRPWIQAEFEVVGDFSAAAKRLT